MIGYYKYDIYDIIECVFGVVIIFALSALPILLTFRS